MKINLKKVSDQYDIPAAEVRREIDEAIEIGMADPDPSVRKIWNTIPHKGDIPTAEELIAWAVDQIKQGKIS